MWLHSSYFCSCIFFLVNLALNKTGLGEPPVLVVDNKVVTDQDSSLSKLDAVSVWVWVFHKSKTFTDGLLARKKV